MTNWVINKLTIHGPAEEIKRFEDGLRSDDHRFSSLQDYLGIEEPGRLSELRKVCPTELIFEFDSPWMQDMSIDLISALFPELHFYFEYYDEMMNFEGFQHWINGELIEHHHGRFPPEIFQELESGLARPMDEIKEYQLLPLLL
jgi:hypothetical protein